MFFTFRNAALCAGVMTIVSATPVLAHATFETPEAAQNSGYKGVVRIGHGCEGTATHTVRIQIPEGIIAVKPMPKAGWTVKTITGAYAKSYDYFGKPMAEGVKEIVWSGGKLQDAEYDEFVFSGRVTDALPAGKTAFVPVTQLCEKGVNAWVEIPAEGQDAHALKSPAPGIRIKASQQVAQANTGHAGHAMPAAPAASGVTVAAPWTRATPPGSKVAGGFMLIDNKGAAADRLVSGSFEASNIVEIHEMAMDNGVMKMRALEKGLEIKAGGKVELKPGGYHIMFIDLKRPLKEGETVKGELVFEKAGKVPVEYKVVPIGSTPGAHQHH